MDDTSTTNPVNVPDANNLPPSNSTPQSDSSSQLPGYQATPVQPAFQAPAPQKDPPSDTKLTNTPPQNDPSTQPVNSLQEEIKIKYPPLLWEQTQNLYATLEQKLGGSVVGYYTSSSIVGDDVKYFYTHLASIGFKERIYFVLFTGGGDGKSAYRIASLLKSFCNELVIVVPEIAASAGTMLCLAGDKIMMTPLSFLTAVDTSITHPLNPKDSANKPVSVGLEEVRRAVELLEKNSDTNKSEIYKLIFNYIHPVAYGNMSRTSNLSEMLCKDLLKLRKARLEPADEDVLIEKLNRSLPAHGYPITRNIAMEMGLPVEKTTPELDNLLWQFITMNKAMTEPVRTDIDHSHFHSEQVLNVIESVGRRLTIRNSYERRLDPILKGWTTLRNTYKWEKTYEVEEDGKKKIMISSLSL